MKILNPLKSQTEYGWHFEQNVYASAGLTRAVKAGGGSGNIPKIIEDMAKKYRIRKLTPSECFALMGVREGDVQKLRNCGVSESQQYKMAGNSIVVDVLMGIFEQMFDPKYVEESSQLSLW